MQNLNDNGEDNPTNEFIKLLIEITNSSVPDNPFIKYKDNIDSSILLNPSFRTNLYSSLQQLINFYNENNYYEEKYMMVLINLIFGVSPQSSTSSQKKRNPISKNIIASNDLSNPYYKDQNDKIMELSVILIHTILNIQKFFENNDETEDLEEVENLFDSEIKEYFLRHFCLFSESLHKLIDVLYYELEPETTEYRDYVLFIQVLVENKNNFRPLIISKFNRQLDQYNNEEIDLLSLREEIDFSNELNILDTTQKLKALSYITKQKMYNSSMVIYDDIKHVNRHFLSSKCKITKEKFENIYCLKGYKEAMEKKKNNKFKNKEEMKEMLQEEIQNVKNDLNTLNKKYSKDMKLIKIAWHQTQKHFSTNYKMVTDKLTRLELLLEKIDI